MRNNLQGSLMYDMRWMRGQRYGILKQAAIAATYNIPSDAPPLLFLALSSAQNVVLPAPSEGQCFRIANNSGGAFTATIKQNDGTTTLTTAAQNAVVDVFSDGVTWFFK